MSERVGPNHCPYCGEEDLRPQEAEAAGWECRSCLRLFSLRFQGMAPRPASASGGSQ
ncbi:MAG: hypothetical protein L0H31_01735 [Nocardioidaceae bacterium]|nr:hypothetical protein [Nocardioidaceae bacterium]